MAPPQDFWQPLIVAPGRSGGLAEAATHRFIMGRWRYRAKQLGPAATSPESPLALEFGTKLANANTNRKPNP